VERAGPNEPWARGELAFAALFSACLAAGFFAPSIFLGEVPTQRDFISTFLPYKVYAARYVAAGRLPLWSPEAGFGAPFLANYQSGVLYPLSAIFYVLPNATGIGLYLAANLWVAGFGTGLWLKSRGVGPEARMLGIVVMMLGGVMISITPWSHLPVAVWIPLALFLAERLVEEPRARRFIALTAVLTLQVLAGAPETFAQSSVLVAAGSLLAARNSARPRRGLALVGLAGAFALVLCAVQLLPTGEYYLQTERVAGLSHAEGMFESLPVRSFLTFLFPHRVDDGVIEPPIEGRVPLFWSFYIGLAPLCLLPIGLVSRGGVRWGLVGAVALVFSLGRNTPVYPFLYDCLPRLFGAFRYPQKFLVTAHVALVMLVAYGLDRLLATGARPVWRRRLLGWILVAFTIFDLVEVHAPALLFTDWRELLRSPPRELLSLGSRARLFLYQPVASGISTWLPRFFFARDWRRRQEVLWSSLAANISLVYGVRFVNNGDSFASGNPPLKEFYRALRTVPVDAAVHALRTFNVGILSGEKPLESPELETMREGGEEQTWIYRLIDPAPEVYLARRVHPVASVAAAMAQITRASFVPGTDATLEDPPPFASGELAGGRATIIREDPRDLVIEIDAAGPSIVVLTDTFFPGWDAEVDGHPVPILRANGLVRAVAVEGGRHNLAFFYRPRSFRWGLLISLAAALLFASVMVALTCLDRRRARRRLACATAR
jgi:hypothetical protein